MPCWVQPASILHSSMHVTLVSNEGVCVIKPWQEPMYNSQILGCSFFQLGYNGQGVGPVIERLPVQTHGACSRIGNSKQCYIPSITHISQFYIYLVCEVNDLIKVQKQRLNFLISYNKVSTTITTVETSLSVTYTVNNCRYFRATI